jgi:spermidine synthase
MAATMVAIIIIGLGMGVMATTMMNIRVRDIMAVDIRVETLAVNIGDSLI